MNKTESIKSSGQLLILSLLQTKDMYGYEMIEALRLRSENIFNLKEGTLYPLLHRLEKENFLKSYTQLTEENRQRKYYKITRKGLEELEKEKESWRSYSKAVSSVINFAK